MWKYEVYDDQGGHYRWRLKADNGETVAVSGESFANRANAIRAATGFKQGASGWKYESFRDKANQYRWHAQSVNNRLVASSGQSFSDHFAAARAGANVKLQAGGASGP